MHTTTARCDGIIALIDECLAEYESTTPLRVLSGSDRAVLQPRTDRTRAGRVRCTALQIVGA